MKKAKKRATAAIAKSASHKEAISPIVQFGVVFFFVAVLVLVFFVAKFY